MAGGKFTTISLDDYKGKYLVLVFYPFDFTYVCPTELISYSEHLPQFQQLGAEVLGVSVSSGERERAGCTVQRLERSWRTDTA